jgi:hypothetical protein
LGRQLPKQHGWPRILSQQKRPEKDHTSLQKLHHL